MTTKDTKTNKKTKTTAKAAGNETSGKPQEQRPCKGQAPQFRFAQVGFKVRHMACRGGADSKPMRTAVDICNLRTGKHRLFCYCAMNARGEADAKIIADALNAVEEFGAIRAMNKEVR